jgi:hypothetical protein
LNSSGHRCLGGGGTEGVLPPSPRKETKERRKRKRRTGKEVSM